MDEVLDRAGGRAGGVARAWRSPTRGDPVDTLSSCPLIARCWELRHSVSPYDAAYVALAEALGVPLLTIDARVARANGIRCEGETLT